MTLASLASLMLALAGPQQPVSLAGLYATDQMEMAGALELQPSGHFRYQFDYGAVSEGAEGDWSSDGQTVRLTSNPMPKEPEFALIGDDPAPPGQIYVAIEDTGTSWSPLTVELTIEGINEPIYAYAGDDGRVEAPEGRAIRSVKMLMPVYHTGGQPVQVSADRGHRLLFRLQPNDIGSAAFQGERLEVRGSALLMHRYDTEIIFQRTEQ